MKAVKSMTVTAVPWSERQGSARQLPSPIPQPAHGEPEIYRSLAVAIFDFRIRRRTGVFSDDSVDHEFESKGIMTPRRSDSGHLCFFKYLKLLQKIVTCGFFIPPLGFVGFCTGNDSKGLALCAARSHIVAVR
jgi:hypothetical protein